MSALPEVRKVTLIKALFEKAATEIDINDYEDYFYTVDAEIKYLNGSRDFKTLSFNIEAEQLVQAALIAVPMLRDSPGSEQATVLQHLQNGDILETQAEGSPRERTILEHVLDAIIRIWLMVDPSPVDQTYNQGWRGQRKLCDFVHGLFYPGQEPPKYLSTPATPARDPELVAEMASETTQIQSSLTHPLTVANMRKLTDITTNWVSHLNKHLEFDADYRDLSVFPHNRWLLDAQEIVQKWRTDNDPINNTPPQTQPEICPFPIPLQVIQETLRSLDLFFPRYNLASNRFLQKHKKGLHSFRVRNHGDIQSRAGSKVRLKEFVFYHDRLIELAQEFISPPKSWNTIFKDYRNPIQYWTFWIGLMIFIATLMSVILAGIQVHYGRQSQM